ncbi:hypothetical protein COCNU_scaffold001627G000010 [Cocos nucifera]|nr:hypothetical protein [Cocos nucifera]
MATSAASTPATSGEDGFLHQQIGAITRQYGSHDPPDDAFLSVSDFVRPTTLQYGSHDPPNDAFLSVPDSMRPTTRQYGSHDPPDDAVLSVPNSMLPDDSLPDGMAVTIN